jgi:hypothetical protein
MLMEHLVAPDVDAMGLRYSDCAIQVQMREERSDGKEPSIYTFIDNADVLLILLPEEQHEASRCLAKAPLGARITKKHEL